MPRNADHQSQRRAYPAQYLLQAGIGKPEHVVDQMYQGQEGDEYCGYVKRHLQARHGTL